MGKGQMKITKDTQCCISIAERPGNFGSTIFNASFKALGLDFIYKPFKIGAEDLPGAIEAIKSFDIRGCGVSMPHKIKVLKYLDKIDPVAKKIGAVNTIVNNKGILHGYNTDFEGAKRAIQENYNVFQKRILIIGAGGVSRAIIMALKENGAGEIFISNRDEKKGKQVAKEFDLYHFFYNQKDDFKGDLLVNATPVGMAPNVQEMLIKKDALIDYRAVMDVVIYPSETRLMSVAKKLGKTVIPGFIMALYQAAAQFKLYTGREAPLGVMFKSMKKFLSEQKSN